MSGLEQLVSNVLIGLSVGVILAFVIIAIHVIPGHEAQAWTTLIWALIIAGIGYVCWQAVRMIQSKTTHQIS